jgi:hypothetical protein
LNRESIIASQEFSSYSHDQTDIRIKTQLAFYHQMLSQAQTAIDQVIASNLKQYSYEQQQLILHSKEHRFLQTQNNKNKKNKYNYRIFENKL